LLNFLRRRDARICFSLSNCALASMSIFQFSLCFYKFDSLVAKMTWGIVNGEIFGKKITLGWRKHCHVLEFIVSNTFNRFFIYFFIYFFIFFYLFFFNSFIPCFYARNNCKWFNGRCGNFSNFSWLQDPNCLNIIKHLIA
jgi:hypothetical protein